MERRRHNLKLIFPSKENELFSVNNYQKMSSDIFTNSFLNTQYKPYNKPNNFLFFNYNKKPMKFLLNPLNSTCPKNKTNYNISNNNNMFRIPLPSFPNKKPIQSLYKNSMKLVKYPKITNDNYTIYNSNKIYIPKIKDEEKTYNNTFFDSRLNAETQTYTSKINRTQYKGHNHLMKLDISPIKKQPKIKYSYKLYNFGKEKTMKNNLQKKLNINKFENILNNMIRIIEMRDEHNNNIKFDKVTNLLIDEIYNLIQDKIMNKKNKNKRKNLKNIATSISHKYLKGKNDILNNSEELEWLRKKIKFKTFIPATEKFQVRYSFNSDIGNKVEDNEFFNYNSKRNNFNKTINDKIKEIKNEDSFDNSEDESNSLSHRLKSKYYNLLSKFSESKGNFRKNLNFDNNYKKTNDDFNSNNDLSNDINENNNSNNNSIFGNSNSFNFNDFFNQSSRRGKSNKMAKNNNNKKNENIKIHSLLGDISSKIEKKVKLKNNKDKQEKQEINITKEKNNSIDVSKEENKKSRKSMEIKGMANYENHIKNKKLINLLKDFFKLEKISEEDYVEEISDNNNEDEDEENKKNSTIKTNEYNTIDDYVSKKNNINIGTVKRKKRKAKTNIIKRIDFGIEIIKNICEEINLHKKDKEELFNKFLSLKNISIKPEISKEEEKIQNKSLRIINEFIKKYILDLQKSELITRLKQKSLLAKYFKSNLNDRLNVVLNENKNANIKPRKENNITKNKPKKKPKQIQRKKLIYDNSYLFKSDSKDEIALKTHMSFDENNFEEINKIEKESPYYSPKKNRPSKFKRRKAIILFDKKIEGLKHIIPIEGDVLTDEEREIERENLLDRRLKAFFDQIKLLKNINDNNGDRLNFFIDKEVEKIDYAQDKRKEIRKYNFFEELKLSGNLVKKEKKINNVKKDLFFQSPLIFNIHKDNNKK